MLGFTVEKVCDSLLIILYLSYIIDESSKDDPFCVF